MWIQVRLMGGKKTYTVNNLSKLSKIETLRKRLVEPFNVEPDNQRLFFRGKQMEDGHTLFDYDVGLNDLIQLLAREDTPKKNEKDNDVSEKEECFASEISLSDDEVSSDKENKEKVQEKTREESDDVKPLPPGHIYK
ncbi:hypothetical protein EGW08_014733, partial [Elysia chlorotica]